MSARRLLHNPFSKDRARSFEARLALTFTLVLVAVGAIQYGVASRDISARIIEEGVARNSVAADNLLHALEAANADEEPFAEITEVLYTLAQYPGTDHVLLFNENGAIAAASDPDTFAEGHGHSHSHFGVARVLETGRGYVDFPTPNKEGRNAKKVSYFSPVRLPGGLFVLEVAQTELVLSRQITDLRFRTLWLLVLGLLLAIPLSYVFGGRTLSARHRTALENSMRDSLTGLGNHREYQEEIGRQVAHASRSEESLSLAVIDVDDLKLANDRRGHSYGDTILVALAGLLQTGRTQDRAFRLGGDRFAFILAGTDTVGACAALDRIRLVAADRLWGTRISIGIAGLEGATGDSQVLLEQADAALSEAKRRGRDLVVSFDDLDEDAPSIATPEKVRALRRLLVEGDIAAAYQPIWGLENDTIIGYEALARLSPKYGLGEGPLEAFDVADKLRRTPELDALCRKAALTGASALPPQSLVFINVAPQALGHATLAGNSLIRSIQEAGLKPEQVVLEITERSTERPALLIREVKRLRSLGIQVALDDVGTGNAGLELLRHLPLNYVKIAREVVQEALTDKSARAVFVAIIAFASQTGTFVVAEGIENEQMLAFVRHPHLHGLEHQMGAQGAQGYLLGRPNRSVEWPAPASIRSGRPRVTV
ncbi:MAG: bifunctional diguanylate cyclase/phosphodiesterase [Actinobacteria bacterium]|nr:bifunctional diguanylate cyclase/phosphodiesterase [Actinomycetota bacterium]MDQ3530839.1 bifunctional diguanylate cyclase/phosphodiesterase [Actinomycetota bacterium]